MAQLQLEAAPLSSSAMLSTGPDQIRNKSPEKWVDFSRNPAIHDDIVREARLRELNHTPLVEVVAALGPTPDVGDRMRIKEVFTPITVNRDGARVPGQQQTETRRGNHQPSPPANTQTVSHRRGADKQKRNRQTQSKGRAASGNNPSQAPSPSRPHGNQVNIQRDRVRTGPSPRKNKRHSTRQEETFPSRRSPPAEPLDIFQPAAQGFGVVRRAPSEATADLMSLMGESDLGFDAEVLGVRRGRHCDEPSSPKTKTPPRKVQKQMGLDAESLMSFGGDGACSPTKAARSPNDEPEKELLIDP